LPATHGSEFAHWLSEEQLPPVATSVVQTPDDAQREPVSQRTFPEHAAPGAPYLTQTFVAPFEQ
jgi:hypothetical protein